MSLPVPKALKSGDAYLRKWTDALLRECDEVHSRLADAKTRNAKQFSERKIGDIMQEQWPSDNEELILRVVGHRPVPWKVRRKLLDTLTYAVDDFEVDKFNERDSSGQTPLYWALHRERVDCVEYLLSKGASPDSTTADGKRLLDEFSYVRSSRDPEALEMQGILNFRQLQKILAAKTLLLSIRFDLGWIMRRSIPVKSLFTTQMISGSEGENTIVRVEPNRSYWIHIPYTFGPAILATVRALVITKKADLLEYALINYFIRSFLPPGTRPESPLLSYRDPDYDIGYRISDEFCIKCSYMVFPCFHLRSFKELDHRKRRIKELFDLFGYEELESCQDRILLSLERSLDETYFPGLDMHSLEASNEDQVVYREYKRRLGTTSRKRAQSARSDKSAPAKKKEGIEPENDAPVIMIPQVWLWRLDNVLISARPPIEEDKSGGLRSLSQSHHRSNSHALSVDLQIGLILANLISDFGRKQDDENHTQTYSAILDMFESALVAVLSDIRKYVKSKVKIKFNIEREAQIIHYISDIRSELNMIKSVLKQQEVILGDLIGDPTRDDLIDGTRWPVMLGEASAEDTRAEISQKKLTDQEKIYWLGVINKAEEERKAHGPREETKDEVEEENKGQPQDSEEDDEKRKKWQSERVAEWAKWKADNVNGWRDVEDAKWQLDQHLLRIDKIDGDAERIEKTVESFMNLKRTSAGIEEARESVIIGKAALGFAVITIIFTPLSFLASLFALPTEQLVKQQRGVFSGTAREEDAPVYRNWYIGVTFALGEILSLIVTGLIVWYGMAHWKRQEDRKRLKDEADIEREQAAKVEAQAQDITINPKPNGFLTMRGRRAQVDKGEC